MENLNVLIEKCRGGDMDAFGELVERFQDMAIGYAQARLGDFHLAQDVAQEAFIDVYLKLHELRSPAAFPGWFRKILHTRCMRLTRKNRSPTRPLNDVQTAVSPGQGMEIKDEVLAALQALPEPQRMATTLFYINGYSQQEIADFLEVPVTTVQKRLHDSRRKLKERMLEMVEDTLKDNAPDERFSQSIIASLLARPKPLEIEGHPVRLVAEAIMAALPEYERLYGDETVSKSDAVGLVQHPDRLYHVSEGQVLRTETTITTFLAAAQRKPPIRLLVCGRVFRPDPESEMRSKVFHQIDVLHMAEDVTEDLMRETLDRAIRSALGDVELLTRPQDYAVTEGGFEVYVRDGEHEMDLAGCGMIARDYIVKSGHDPDVVHGFSFGIGIERLAMLKYGINDIRALWRPPYVNGM